MSVVLGSVSSFRSDLLLGSPLGRQVLAGYLGDGSGRPFEVAFFEQLGLGPGLGGRAAGRRAALLGGRHGGRGRLPDAGAGNQPSSPRPLRRWQDVTRPEVRSVIGAYVARQRWRELLAGVSECDLLGDLSGETFSFGFSGCDVEMWRLTAVGAEELRPVADALVSCPGACRWWEPVALADQRFVEWKGQPRLDGPATERTVREGMQAECAQNIAGLRETGSLEPPGRKIMACWLSAPRFAGQTWTTTAAGGLPALALCQFFDAYVPTGAVPRATVWSVRAEARARVLEINRPADWQRLVSRFPRDVTGTHDGEWRYWGGVAGPWRLPDWEQVMRHYDGVHVTIGGFISSCGLALPVTDGYTMLTGWLPGATLWLRDMATGVRRLGRWDGGPQFGRWDDHPAEWTPDGQRPR